MTSPAINVKLGVRLERAQRIALAVGVAGAAGAAAAFAFARREFYFAYLTSYLLFLGLALGSMGVVALHHLVGGRWGRSIRRLLEASSRTLWLVATGLIPLYLGRRYLYEWVAHPPAAGSHKAIYLCTPFFFGRAVGYFVLWMLLAAVLNALSRRQERSNDPAAAGRLRAVSGPVLVLYCLTVTAAAFDWVMSLTPDWYSSIFGMMFIVGQGLSTLAFCTVVLMLLARYEPFAGFITANDFHDLGNLLLTFVILWAYIAFSQYLIIWSGNLREEIVWYQMRDTRTWRAVAALLMLVHFALPFALLLARGVKRRARAVAAVAIVILVMRWVDLTWLVEPAARIGGIWTHWVDLVMPLALGGFWLTLYIHQLRRLPLLAPQPSQTAKEAGHA